MSSRHDPYHFTSLGRPLDPSWATNRAVLILMPVGAVIAVVLELARGGDAWVSTILAGAGTVLLCWALGRELAPDDQAAAFVAMALGYGVTLLVGDASLLAAGAALLLSRTVNGTVGLPLRRTDVVGAIGVTAWAALSLHAPEIWVAAGLAFGFAARFRGHNGVGAVCVALGIAAFAAQWALHPGTGAALASRYEVGPGISARVGAETATAALTAIAFLGAIARTRQLDAVADATGVRLDPRRVRAGMWVVWVLLIPTIVGGDRRVAQFGLVWATVLGVSISALLLGAGRRTTFPSSRRS